MLTLSPDPRGRVDLARLFEQLELSSVLIEGGGGIITSALAERLVQRLVICISPKVIGAGIEAVGDLQHPAPARRA